jgi:RNA polymerase sigma factor (TIGR02999 family)
MSPVTQLLEAIGHGDGQASQDLLPLVYNELRQLAAARLARENPGQTLQATALVHEAYLRLVGAEGGSQWEGRAHFFGAAAEAMRRILVDQARRKGRIKRGGGHQRHDLEVVAPAAPELPVDMLVLDEALDDLARLHADKAQLVKLRYFAGLTLAEAADLLGISPATADRHWKFARAWLASRLQDEPADSKQSAAGH